MKQEKKKSAEWDGSKWEANEPGEPGYAHHLQIQESFYVSNQFMRMLLYSVMKMVSTEIVLFVMKILDLFFLELFPI